jgi:hypothetical protein
VSPERKVVLYQHIFSYASVKLVVVSRSAESLGHAGMLTPSGWIEPALASVCCGAALVSADQAQATGHVPGCHGREE